MIYLAWISPGTVSTKFMDSVLGVIRDERVLGHISLTSGPRISTARNQVCETFLLSPRKPEWLFMLDSDMTFDSDILDRLLEAAHEKLRPVIGGLCFAGGRIGKPTPTLQRLTDPKKNKGRLTETIYTYPRDALCKVDATGAAALFIHRDVLLQMKETFNKMPDGYPNPHPWFAESVQLGHEYGEDWTFCMRLKQMKVPLYVHTGIKLGHIKTVNYDEEFYLDYRRNHGSQD